MEEEEEEERGCCEMKEGDREKKDFTKGVRKLKRGQEDWGNREGDC